MTRYLMRFDTNTVELAWEYSFTMPSDHMALDYARRMAISIKHNLVVFKQEIDDEYAYIGRVEVSTTAKVMA